MQLQQYEAPMVECRHEQLMHLWMLRILVPLCGYRRFIGRGTFANDTIAEVLGLCHWSEDPWRDVDQKVALQKLRQAHQAAEEQRHLIHAGSSVLAANIERLSQQLGLSFVEERLLEFAVILHNEQLLMDTVEMLDELPRIRITQILSVLLDAPLDTIEQALSPKGKLIATGLLTRERGRRFGLSNALSVLSDDFARSISAGPAEPEELLKDAVRKAPHTTLKLADYHHIHATLQVLIPYLTEALKTGRKGVNIFMYGQPGTGKTELTRLLADTLDVDVFEVATDDSRGEPANSYQRLRALRAGQGLFADQRALMVFDEAEDVFNNTVSLFEKSAAQQHKGWVNYALENNTIPTLWLSNDGGLDPAFIRRFDMVFELPIPPRSQRQRILQHYGNGLLNAPTMARFAAAEALAPAVIARTCAVLSTIEQTPQERNAAFAQMVNATLKAQGHSQVLAAGSPLPPIYDTAFVNTNTALDTLAQGIAEAQSARLCFYGPPGTGKTAYAHWLAKALDKPLLIKRAADLMGKYVGENEQNIAHAFIQAEQEGAILLIDEVDSFLRERQGAQQHWEVSMVNEMLTRMEAFTGVFIASTNLMDHLDAAALRRFDLKLEFDYLTTAQAQQLFERYCQTLGLHNNAAAQAQLSHLQRLTPGDFAAVVRQHRFRPVATAQQLADTLAEEVALKGGNKHPFGFV